MSDPKEEAVTNKKFRLQNQRILLTYKTHIDKAEFKQWLEKKFSSYQTRFCEIAHETGDEQVPYLHSHVLIDWGKPFQSLDVRVLDFKEIHPHIKPITTALHYRNAKKYLAKEDASLKHLIEAETPFTDKIWNCGSLEEALARYTKKANDVQGITQLWRLKPAGEKAKMPYDPFPWQEQLFEKIDKPTSIFDRKIIWIYEKKGNTGKSYFASYWFRQDPKRFYYVSQFDGAKNAATIIKSAVESGWSGHCLFIDLKRAQQEHCIYTPIEMIKDGLVTATKYEGGTVDLGTRPHIVIFANWLPDIQKLSVDRWDINQIVFQGEPDCVHTNNYVLHALNITDARAAYGEQQYISSNSSDTDFS